MTNQGENTPRRGVIVPGLSNGDYLKPQSNARYDELMRKLVLVIAFEAAAGGVTQVLTDALLLWFWITVMVGFPLVLYWREIKTWLRGKWFLPKTKKEKLQSLYPMFERVLELDRRITAEQDFDDVLTFIAEAEVIGDRLRDLGFNILVSDSQHWSMLLINLAPAVREGMWDRVSQICDSHTAMEMRRK